jgi:hypothetical protein
VLALPGAWGGIGFVSHKCLGVGGVSGSGRALPFPAGLGQIGFVWRNKPQRRLRRRLRRPAPISVRVGKLASFVQAVTTTTPLATSPVPTHSCRWGKLASFRTHSFGVPPLGGKDQSDPRKRGTPNGPRSPAGSLFLGGKSSTMAHAGPLTTKPSKVVVSYLCFAILLPDYHTNASIPRQVKLGADYGARVPRPEDSRAKAMGRS